MAYNPKSARTKYRVPIWADALLRDTLNLDAELIGAWHLLIYAMWGRESLDLFDDDRQLATICRTTKTKFRRHIRPILEPLFKVENGRWRNTRLEREAEATEKFLMSQYRRGVGSGAASNDDQPPLPLNEREPVRPEFRQDDGPPQSDPAEATYRERILTAAGADPVSGVTGRGGSRLGDRAQMIEAARWRDDLGLTEDQIIEVVNDTMARKSDRGPPSTLSYFTKAMERAAGQIRHAQTKRMEVQDVPTDDNNPGRRRAASGGASRAHQSLGAGFARALSDIRDGGG